jgi:hypothetical protein
LNRKTIQQGSKDSIHDTLENPEGQQTSNSSKPKDYIEILKQESNREDKSPNNLIETQRLMTMLQFSPNYLISNDSLKSIDKCRVDLQVQS